LDLVAYDAILGYDWLMTHSPMVCHWENKTLEFLEGVQHAHLQGIQQEPPQLSEMSPKQFVKCQSGNDIWALAFIQPVQLQSVADNIPQSIEHVLNDFQDVFAESTKLPPHRSYDHTIPLLPRAAPVNARPYKYSSLHKDEIEKQVKELLSAVLITHSTSPFASPVLLVQKKDGT
jgi:hypothetical protein